MPIRINLLAESIAAEEQRRRDPIKRVVFGGALVVAVSLVWYSSTWLSYMVDKDTLNRVEAEIQTHTNDYARVQDNIKQIADANKRMAALDELTKERFLQGNLLNALQQTYVPNVQLNHLRVDQTYSESPAMPAKTNKFGVVAGRPAKATEHVVVQMEAKDFSPNPGDQVNHFKDALLDQEYFKTSCDPASGVRLTALSPLQSDKSDKSDTDSKLYVMFSLECRFLDRP